MAVLCGQHCLVLIGFFLSVILSMTDAASRSHTISFDSHVEAEAGGMRSIQISYNLPHNGELSIHYGACDLGSPASAYHEVGKTYVGNHPAAKRHIAHPQKRPTRFVWLLPDDTISNGCLHAFAENVLLGKSAPITILRRSKKRWLAAADVMDALGPWFDGVAYLKEKEPDDVFVAKAKAQKIGILGGGMSGLMTAHLLDSVGFHDWTIIEASHRIGGRVHTAYLNGTRPDEYQYQEMGPMRFPVSITYPETNETLEIQDHRLVFQLADVLNKQNRNNSDYHVNFIKWIQNSANAPADTSKRRPDGTVPGVTEVMSNPSYEDNQNLTYSNVSAVYDAMAQFKAWSGRVTFADMAKNVYRAHKKAVEIGLFDFSEAGFLNYVLQYSKNISDQVDSFADNYPAWLYDDEYFSATDWRTVDQGLNRLPTAFEPQVLNRTVFNTTVQGMSWDEENQKVRVEYRNESLFSKEPAIITFDYTVVAVPFSRVRLWRLPSYSSLLSRAINNLNYDQSCKVALMYKTRFWEKLTRPIYGGCGSTDIPGIGSICYPSYKINSSLPGVLLASYVSTTPARSVAALTESQHIALVQRAMVEVHGDVADAEYTGIYNRMCWEVNEFQAGAWADPLVGQQDLYLPAYFHTEKHTVFVGEHTSYTHAWIWSALESAVRGTAQLLLDMGLVEEAKEVTNFWMARWIQM